MEAPGAIVDPGPQLTSEQREFFARHLTLPGIGIDGQRRLLNAKILVVGAGGLGSPILLYLGAAGVGTLGVVDDDVVETSNLHRQVIHRVGRAGTSKVTSARDALGARAPYASIVMHEVRLTPENAVSIVQQYDLVVDGSDNFATRYVVGDACELLGIPSVWGAILRYEGQVSVFWPGVSTVYRDIFPQAPDPSTVPSCAEAGVFGALCGSIGSAMATEAIKLVTGVGRPLLDRVLVHDALDMTWRELATTRDSQRRPVSEVAEEPSARPAGVAAEEAVTVEELAVLLSGSEPPLLLDVREQFELDAGSMENSIHVPKDDVIRGEGSIPEDRDIVVYCASGVRSAQVLRYLVERGYSRVRHLDGGYAAWAEQSGLATSGKS